jgi:hypothetical protein
MQGLAVASSRSLHWRKDAMLIIRHSERCHSRSSSTHQPACLSVCRAWIMQCKEGSAWSWRCRESRDARLLYELLDDDVNKVAGRDRVILILLELVEDLAPGRSAGVGEGSLRRQHRHRRAHARAQIFLCNSGNSRPLPPNDTHGCNKQAHSSHPHEDTMRLRMREAWCVCHVSHASTSMATSLTCLATNHVCVAAWACRVNLANCMNKEN